MTDQPVLSVQNLTTAFDSPYGRLKAVDGVSFNIRAGEVLSLLGESGSGKSVTALSLMRLLPRQGRIASGQVKLDGEDIVPRSEAAMCRLRGRKMSMIFQEPMTSLNPVYTVGDQIAEVFRRNEGESRDRAWKRAVEVLDMVNIPSAAQRAGEYPHQFSGGMRQRVMIAMAISGSPRLLIADEPTTALDVTIQAQILDLILRLASDLSMAVLLITHDLGVVAETADRVAVMYAGRIVENMSVDELFDTPRHPYTQGLLRSTPKLGRKFKDGKQPLQEIPGTVPALQNLPAGCAFAPRCTHAHDRCAEEPPFFAIEPDHNARCWLARENMVTSP